MNNNSRYTSGLDQRSGTYGSPLRVLLQGTDKLPHNALARLVVEHVGNMPLLTSKVLAMGVSTEAFIVWLSSDKGYQAVSKLREGFNEILDNALTSFLHVLYDELVDRVKNGDIYIDRETGESYRKPLRAMVITNIFDKIFDKRDRLRDKRRLGATIEATVSLENISKEDFIKGRDSESLARTMRLLAEKGSGLIIRKKTEETELISQVSSSDDV